MRGAVLYGPRDVRFEERDAENHQADRCHHPDRGHVRVRVGPVAVPRAQADRRADADGARVLRHRRGGRQRGEVRQAGPVRHRLVLRVRQHLSQLPVRLPVVLPAREFIGRAQAPLLRVPLADGTLVPTPDVPSDDLVPSLLALSDVLGTGWFAADAANVKPGSTVVVVGDGAVGLLGVLSAKQMGAERIIAMSRHESRQKLAREFGATDIVTERGDEGVARIKDMTKGIGADSVLECVGTQESMMQAIRCHAPRRVRGLRRRPARGRAQRRGTVLRARPPPRRPRPGAALPAQADRPGAGTGRSTPARSST